MVTRTQPGTGGVRNFPVIPLESWRPKGKNLNHISPARQRLYEVCKGTPQLDLPDCLGFRFATIGFGLATRTKIVTSDYPLLDEMIRRNIPLTRENYILLDCRESQRSYGIVDPRLMGNLKVRYRQNFGGRRGDLPKIIKPPPDSPDLSQGSGLSSRRLKEWQTPLSRPCLSTGILFDVRQRNSCWDAL